MNTRNTPARSNAAMTLVEITLVISVLLSLISVLFIGSDTYKKGTDRASCIQQIAKVQQAMRSFCNVYEYSPGDTLDLKDALIRPGGFYETEPNCPAEGTYTYYPTRVPPVGEPFIQCSIERHTPSSTTGW